MNQRNGSLTSYIGLVVFLIVALGLSIVILNILSANNPIKQFELTNADPPEVVGEAGDDGTANPTGTTRLKEAELELRFPGAIAPFDSEEVRVDIYVPEIFESLNFELVDKIVLNEASPPLLGESETHNAFLWVSNKVYVVAQSSDFNPQPSFPNPDGGNRQAQAIDFDPGGQRASWIWVLEAPAQPQKGILTISIHNAADSRVLWNRNIEINVQSPPATAWEWVQDNASTLAALATVLGALATGFARYIWPIMAKRRLDRRARPRTAEQIAAFSAEIKTTSNLSQLNNWLDTATDPSIRETLTAQIEAVKKRQRLIHRDLPDALVDAFDTSRFERMLQAYFDTRLEEITNSDEGLRGIVMEVIEYAEMRDQLLDLVRAAREANPDNQQLASVTDAIVEYFEAD